MGEFRSFSRLMIVELAGSAAGAYCAKQFANLGSEVVVVGEPFTDPGGSFYDTPKRRLAIDDDLLSSADVVIQSSAPDPIAKPAQQANPAQIVVRISPFAATGPYSSWRATDIVDSAISGHLRLSGDPQREPLQGVPDLVHHAAGMTAFIGAVAALIARVRAGRGQVVQTSHQEVLAALHQFTLCRYTHNGAVLNRQGNRYAGPGSTVGAYQCSDGWIGLALPQEDQLQRMLDVTGLVTMLEHDDVDSIWDLMTGTDLLNRELVPYLKTQNRQDLVELFQALRLPCAPVVELNELLDDEHLAARGFWRRSPDGEILLPGPPFRLSDHDWTVGPSRREGRLPTAMNDEDRSSPTGGPPAAGPPIGRPVSHTQLSDGPLTGLRVIDMTRVWAGPLAARILADLGAEVLMTEVPWTRTPREVPDSYVEATRFFPLDEAGQRPWNRSAFHNKYANNKRSAVIDLDTEPGRELLAALIPTADVLVENYSPRVMPDLGFGAAALHGLNPSLVYVTMPGYGRSGPYRDWVAYGPTIDGHIGHTSLTGYRGEEPWKCGVAWPDPIGGLHGAAAALVALLDRFVEPERGGQTVEVAQIESAINMIGQHVVAAQLEGVAPRRGNRRPGRAPQGVYRCAGDDRWIAISVVDDTAWHGLCEVVGWSDVAHLDQAARWDRHHELDQRLSAFTADHDDQELMRRLQAAGVPAGAVLDASQVMADPQLDALGYFVQLDHPDAGTHPWPRFPARLSLTPATLRSPAALMGEHNHYAACTLAGYGPKRYQKLLDDGVLRVDPPA